MTWLKNLIEIICKNENLLSELTIQCNPLLREQVERFTISYFIQNEDKKSISIRKSPFTEAIFHHSKNGILIGELLQILSQSFPKLEPEKLYSTINTLLKQEFLWFSLFPSLLSSSPFEKFLAKVPSQYADQLSSLYSKILDYSNSKLGDGLDLLHNIDRSMREIATSPSCIQVDAISPTAQITIAEPILQEIAEGIDVLMHIDANAFNQPTSAYFEKFIEKYGYDRSVPLFELIDDTNGLGMPDFYQTFNDEKAQPFSIWIQNALAECLWEKRQEIEITDEIMHQWPKKAELEKAPLSADVFFELLGESQTALNEGNYWIVITNIIPQGGGVFGRFLDMFSDEEYRNNLKNREFDKEAPQIFCPRRGAVLIDTDRALDKKSVAQPTPSKTDSSSCFGIHEKLKTYYEKEEKLDPSTQFVESSFLPSNPKGQNVGINHHFRQEVIDLSPGGKSTLFLSEIYIGASKDKLFLSSKDGTKEYYITATNVLNPLLAPKVLRFLRDISMSKYRTLRFWNWEGFSEMPHLPRIRYKKLILSPAKWNVTLEKIHSSQKETEESMMKKFSLWADKYAMPDYIYITDLDNKLLLNRKNNAHLQIIIKRLKTNNQLLLTEKIMQAKGEWVKSEAGVHAAEFVLPLLKNSAYLPKHTTLQRTEYKEYTPKQRMQLPGGEWLYSKFFISRADEKTFLIHHLQPFAAFLKENKMIEQMFFVRYKEEKEHLRIRFKTDIANNKLIHLMHDWVYSLLDKGIIQDWQIASYSREIERYGGLELIEDAETIFCLDSDVVLKLLQKEKELALPLTVVGAMSVVQMLHDLGFNLSKQLAFFSFIGADKTQLKGVKEWRKTFLSVPLQLQDIFNLRSAELSSFSKKLDQRKKDEFSIISSLIHMHCNRLIGIDRQQENKIMAFAEYAAQHLSFVSNRQLHIR